MDPILFAEGSRSMPWFGSSAGVLSHWVMPVYHGHVVRSQPRHEEIPRPFSDRNIQTWCGCHSLGLSWGTGPVSLYSILSSIEPSIGVQWLWSRSALNKHILSFVKSMASMPWPAVARSRHISVEIRESRKVSAHDLGSLGSAGSPYVTVAIPERPGWKSSPSIHGSLSVIFRTASQRWNRIWIGLCRIGCLKTKELDGIRSTINIIKVINRDQSSQASSSTTITHSCHSSSAKSATTGMCRFRTLRITWGLAIWPSGHPRLQNFWAPTSVYSLRSFNVKALSLQKKTGSTDRLTCLTMAWKCVKDCEGITFPWFLRSFF